MSNDLLMLAVTTSWTSPWAWVVLIIGVAAPLRILSGHRGHQQQAAFVPVIAPVARHSNVKPAMCIECGRGLPLNAEGGREAAKICPNCQRLLQALVD